MSKFLAFAIAAFGVFGGASAAVSAEFTPDASLRASWYGGSYHGKRTAAGERFDQNGMTAAHPDLPFGTVLAVRRMDGGPVVVVRINDRCGRCELDLSRGAADRLGIRRLGRADVLVQVLDQVALAD